MSLLIKGMEMPTSPVLFCVHPGGKVFADLEGGWREYKAIPVPPHGRLIDADALGTDMWKARTRYQMLDDTQTADKIMHGLYRAEQVVKEAPTIIPAEEGET